MNERIQAGTGCVFYLVHPVAENSGLFVSGPTLATRGAVQHFAKEEGYPPGALLFDRHFNLSQPVFAMVHREFKLARDI